MASILSRPQCVNLVRYMYPEITLLNLPPHIPGANGSIDLDNGLYANWS